MVPPGAKTPAHTLQDTATSPLYNGPEQMAAPGIWMYVLMLLAMATLLFFSGQWKMAAPGIELIVLVMLNSTIARKSWNG